MREIPGPLSSSGNGQFGGIGFRLPQPFIGTKEKQVMASRNGTAECCSKLITVEQALRHQRSLIVVVPAVRIERGIAEVVVDTAVKILAATLRDQRDHAA